MTSARIDTAISAGVCAPIGSPTGVCTRRRCASVSSSASRIACPPYLAGHQPDISHACVERREDRFGLRPAMGGDDDGGGLCEISVTVALYVVAERRAHERQRIGDRRGTANPDQRRGHLRRQEDLQRPPDRQGLTTTHAPGASGKCTSPSGSTRSSTLSPACNAPTPPCAPSSARTDRRRNPRSCRPTTGLPDHPRAPTSGVLGTHNSGVDERRPRTPQLRDPFAIVCWSSVAGSLPLACGGVQLCRRLQSGLRTPACSHRDGSTACRRAEPRTAPRHPPRR